MQTLVEGIHHFQQHVFPSKLRLFKRLAKGQQPIALLIICSDSRINPNLITHTEPGELFIVRNVGNMVPSHGVSSNGERRQTWLLGKMPTRSTDRFRRRCQAL